MPESTLPLETLLRGFLLYVMLPAWVFFGYLDYLCHRATKIETTTGLRETLMHSVMGIQISLPIIMGLFLEINVLILLVMLAVLVFHEYVAHYDVKTTYHKREITVWESHAHSFLEVIPFGIFGLVSLLKWKAFLALVTFRWAGNMGLAFKEQPVSSRFITGYIVFMIFLGFFPYAEEFYRCLRAREWTA